MGAFELQPATSVYVSSAYASDAPGTQVTWADGSTHVVGYDAFGTVQSGVNAVAAGGTVNVAAGTYTEQITISQSLTLAGAGAGQRSSSRRPASTPATSSKSPSAPPSPSPASRSIPPPGP